MNKFTNENFDNIQRIFEAETGAVLPSKQDFRRNAITVRTALAICICITLACASVFAATDEGQALIQKLFFSKPVESEVISFGYEEPTKQEAVNSPGHKGLDIVCDRGTPVNPVLAGTVIEAGFNAQYGNYIVIEHEGGYKSKYAHLESILVETGQDVGEETQIGTVGSTGMSTGPHLHLEMSLNGDPINPAPYIFNGSSESDSAN